MRRANPRRMKVKLPKFLWLWIMIGALLSAPLAALFDLEIISGAAFIAGMLLGWADSIRGLLRRLFSTIQAAFRP